MALHEGPSHPLCTLYHIEIHQLSLEARHSISFKLPSQFEVIFLYITFVTYVTVKSCYHLFYELCNMYYYYNVYLV